MYVLVECMRHDAGVRVCGVCGVCGVCDNGGGGGEGGGGGRYDGRGSEWGVRWLQSLFMSTTNNKQVCLLSARVRGSLHAPRATTHIFLTVNRRAPPFSSVTYVPPPRPPKQELTRCTSPRQSLRAFSRYRREIHNVSAPCC